VDSYDNQQVRVMWKKDGVEDKVMLLTEWTIWKWLSKED
jgi:hypothetical protein